jgi:hypothetical protein
LNKTQVSFLLGALTAVILLSWVSYVYPSLDDLWVENPFWNGLSEFYKICDPVRLSDLSVLNNIVDPSNTTLFILGPSTDFSTEEVKVIKIYLLRGGTLVLADDFGSGNQLLVGMDSNVRFEGGLLEDPLFRERNAVLPVIKTTYVSDPVIFNYATELVEVEDKNVKAWSSPFSYLTSTLGEGGLRARPVIAEIPLGAGRLVLISDSSVFINGMVERVGNRALLESLIIGQVFIDEAHSLPSRLTIVKGQLEKIYTMLGSLELRYGLAVVTVVMIYLVKYGTGVRPIDEVVAVIEKHPEYEKGLVERLRLEREEIHGDYRDK